MSPAAGAPAGAGSGPHRGSTLEQARRGLPPQRGHSQDPAAAPVAHEVTVSHEGPFARATCSTCGWNGPGRRALSRVADDAEEHKELAPGP